VEAVRNALIWFRKNLKATDPPPPLDAILQKIEAHVDLEEIDRLRPVVNGTGILLHTGLGRAVLPQAAVDALAGLNRCCNLQVDLESGLRGKRNFVTERLVCRLTGAEAAMLVNNNAAATFLILTALCSGKEVIVSRGQLIEIGGSYRLPDCIHQSGARLVEVGTTNKTHLSDYQGAITDDTAAILRVNPSNYRVVGFSEEVPVADLVRLRKKKSVLVIDDLGCGALMNLKQYGLPHEPTAPDSLAAGADLVCFSGDKLIGGPQAGIICGRKKLIQKIRKHPLTRMLRVGKMTDLALEKTLRLFLDPGTLNDKNPTLRMITIPNDVLRRRAQKLARAIKRQNLPLTVRVEESESATGGGALPAVGLPTWVVAIASADLGADLLSRFLRKAERPVIGRIVEEAVVLDMRTLMEGDEHWILEALRIAVKHSDKES
jgi:L-seryl-tRNA(Ser) seleniumtransferase